MRELLEMAQRASLVDGGGRTPRLTPRGYLVGNVAKEYCNWLDAGRTIPEQVPARELFAGKDVLDVGCSYGRWLWEFQKHGARSVTGIELQPEFTVLGRALARLEGLEPPSIAVGSVEALSDHFPDSSFDFVFSRLVLTHVPLRRALPPFVRVLRPGGTFWIQIESFLAGVVRIGRELNSGTLRGAAFAAFGVANAVLFSMLGTQVSVRSPGRRMHSKHQPVYPIAAAWRRALEQSGARDCRTEFRNHYSLVVTGTR
jgi:SAM-dependent methyltransferase